MQLIVLGMHRSGTSSVARLLNMMGAYVAPPDLLIAANEENEKGFWERWDVHNLNEAMLHSLHTSWHENISLNFNLLTDSVWRAQFEPQASKILRDLEAHRPWMLKDPRMCLLLPFWKPLLEAPVCIWVYRSPIQVAQSLRKRQGFPLCLGLALWERYSLLGLAHSADMPRLLVSYHDLMAQPAETVQKLRSDLASLDVQGLRLPSAREIEAFIEPRLYHQQGDHLLQERYANIEQIRLNQAFIEGSVLSLKPLPDVSAGAMELLKSHQERQALLANIQHLKQRRAQLLQVSKIRKAACEVQRSKNLEQEAHANHVQAQVAALEEAAERERAAQREQIAALEEAAERERAAQREQIAALEEAAERERAAQRDDEWVYERLIGAEETIRGLQEEVRALLERFSLLESSAHQCTALLEQKIQQYQSSLHHLAQQYQVNLDQLWRWLIALSSNIQAVFGSLTWRGGDFLTRVALAVTFRKPDPGARGQILHILKEIALHRQPLLALDQPVPFGEVDPRIPSSSNASPQSEPTSQQERSLGRHAHFPTLTLPGALSYKSWYARQKCKPKELAQQAQAVQQWTETPKISLAVPCYNSPPQWLDELLNSIHRQSYPFWECILVDDASSQTAHLEIIASWCKKDERFQLITNPSNLGVSGASQTALEAAQGEYFTVVDHDDLLEPNALFEVALAICGNHPDVIYSDEMLVQSNGKIIRCEFRPQFSYHFLLSHPYIVHLTVFRRELLHEVGGFDPTLQVSQDYDLILRVAAMTHEFYHIPKVLYQWRIHSNSTGHQLMDRVMENSIAALNQHLALVGFSADEAIAVQGLSFNFFRVRYKLQPATISVIIPTRDRADLLKMCVESLLSRTLLPSGFNLNLIVVNNDSSEPKVLDFFAQLRKQGHTVLDDPEAFNFSRLNNRAVKVAKGEFLLFLNNDIEIIESDWLEAMLEPMAFQDVGLVGAKLLYPEIGLIQHAGVIIGPNGTAGHSHQFYAEHEHGHWSAGHQSGLLVVRECMAVTAACMLVKRKVFTEVGGFDEALRVGFGDTDLCLRIYELGYKCLYTPYARLIHHESATRGYSQKDTHPADSQLFKKRWEKLISAGDPYYNQNLRLNGKLFEPK